MRAQKSPRLSLVCLAGVTAALLTRGTIASETITFEESLVQPEDVRDQYCAGAANRGVSFLDESQGGSAVRILVPSVATASPSHALTNRYGSEFEEVEKIVIHFTIPQSYVSVKVGLDRAYAGPVLAALIVYEGDTPTTPRLTKSSNLGTGPTPITHELSYTSASADIRCIGVEFKRIDGGWGVTEVIDDLTFSTVGPPCGVIDTTPPVVQILKPSPGMVTHDTYLALQYSAQDTGTGVAKVQVQFLNASGNEVSSFCTCGGLGGQSGPCGASPVTGHFFTYITPDTKTIRVRAWDYAGLTGYADRAITYVPLSSANIWIHAMEVIQMTDPHLCVNEASRLSWVRWCQTYPPLMAGRRTILRIYPGLENSDGAAVHVDVECRCKDTYGQPCPGPQVIGSGFPLVVDPADNNDIEAQQVDASKTLNLPLPEAWTTWDGHGICLTATLHYELECAGCADGANSMTLSNTWFHRLAPLDITVLRGCIRRDPSDPKTQCSAVPTANGPANTLSYAAMLKALKSEASGFVQTHPLAMSQIRPHIRYPNLVLWDGDFSDPGNMGAMTPERVEDFLFEIGDIRWWDWISWWVSYNPFEPPPLPFSDAYYGFFPPPPSTGTGGLTAKGEGYAVTRLDVNDFYNETFHPVAHELGHILESWDIGCAEDWHCRPSPCPDDGICTPGFDAYRMEAINPAGRHDFMTYSYAPHWISPATLSIFWDTLRDWVDSAPTPQVKATAATGSSLLLIRGKIVAGEECSAQITSAYQFSVDTVSLDPGSGTCRIELRNSADEVVFTKYFEPMRSWDDPPDPNLLLCSRHYAVAIPVEPRWGVQSLQVIASRCQPATLVRSPNPPALTLLSPVGGENWATNETHTIAWSAFDPDDPRQILRCTVQYSRDAGLTWTVIAHDVTVESFAISGEELAGSVSAVVRVLVTDGLNTAVAQSGIFTIEDQPPIAFIGSPSTSDGSIPEFPYHSFVTFEGLGTDPEDGPLVDASLTWYSDQDGTLGTGHRLDVRTLSQGYHLIQLIAADGTGKTGVATQPILIAPRINSQPVANAGPDQGAVPGQEVGLDGTGSRDRNGDQLAYYWTLVSAPPGSMAALYDADTATPRIVPYVEGEYVVQLVVRDIAEDAIESLPDQARVIVSTTPPPPNDACANATPIEPGWLLETLTNATNDGSASCGGGGQANTQPDVWYSYTAPQTGVLKVTTCGTHDWGEIDRGMDTVLSLHSGCPATPANQLAGACNDDWPYGPLPTACNGPWPFYDANTSRDSALAAPVMAGQTVLIRVSKYSATSPGVFYLTLAFGGQAPGDFEPDGDVDLADFLDFQACFNGPNRVARGPDCDIADLDNDDDVDLADFLEFQKCFNGPNRSPKCS